MILCTAPQTGGGHQYALLAADALVKNRNSENEIIAICYNSFWRKWCREKKVRVIESQIPYLSMSEKRFNIHFPLLAKIYNMYMTPMGQLLRKEKIRLLFCTQQGVFIPNYNVKIIVPVHDLMHRYEARFPEVRGEYEERELLMKSHAQYATMILVDSKLGKKQFEESYNKVKGKGLKIICLPFVVPEHIHNCKEEFVDVPEKYVFYPAQFWRHKNHINLVKAVGLLKSRIPDVHLVLVGSEKNCCGQIKRYIKDNALEDNITILGFVSNEKITYLYKHAMGMIMPSYFGPTNIPPLEAMALGCPVAVSNKYAMPEQVGNAGLLFNPDSPEEIACCIEQLWLNKQLREEMRNLGYKQIGRWSQKDFCNKLIKVIKNV